MRVPKKGMHAHSLTHCLTRSLIRLCKWDPQLLQPAITCSQRRQRGARARTAPWSHFIIKCQTAAAAAVAAAAAAQRLSERRQRRVARASELVFQSCNTFCVFRMNKTKKKKKNRKKKSIVNWFVDKQQRHLATVALGNKHSWRGASACVSACLCLQFAFAFHSWPLVWFSSLSRFA